MSELGWGEKKVTPTQSIAYYVVPRCSCSSGGDEGKDNREQAEQHEKANRRRGKIKFLVNAKAMRNLCDKRRKSICKFEPFMEEAEGVEKSSLSHVVVVVWISEWFLQSTEPTVKKGFEYENFTLNSNLSRCNC